MILDKIMGYWVTDDPMVLEGFVAHVQEHYDALEQALEPIAATVRNLESDWKPRWNQYWNAKLKDLTALRAANQAELQVFDKEQRSRTVPIPLIIAGTSLGYRCPLHSVESQIEEAGILITSYIDVCDSHQEQHLRQRQRVLNALQEVVKETRKAIKEGRDKLVEDSGKQQKLVSAPPVRKAKHEKAPSSTTDDAETTTAQPVLRVVHEEVVH